MKRLVRARAKLAKCLVCFLVTTLTLLSNNTFAQDRVHSPNRPGPNSRGHRVARVHEPGGLITSRRIQSIELAALRSSSCIQCHDNVGDMHRPGTVNLGCVDCHGGNSNAFDKKSAHVQPRYPEAWVGGANPVRSYTLLNHESPEFIQFVNPGDLRVATNACGECHPNEVLGVKKSMMTHGCMLWGAALYNNGAYPKKQPAFGESYSRDGKPQRMYTVPPPTRWEIENKGVIPFLDPLPRFEVTQPGNFLRIFERGGRFRPEVGIPERLEEPGRPRERPSNRGPGTENRTDPVFIGLQKTRLLDPTLNFMGNNDHAGEYRSSGCTACHVVYANDRSPVNSGPFARYGNHGTAATLAQRSMEKERGREDPINAIFDPDLPVDPTTPKHRSGHPIVHQFTKSIPTSQCIVCHVHPGTNVLNSYTGFMWWDNETDGELMYPRKQRDLTSEEIAQALMRNPNEASLRGLWSDPEFLDRVYELNDRTRHTQFADYHGHGWIFRAVYQKDRDGKLLDYEGDVIAEVTNEKLRDAMVPPTPEEQQKGKCRNDTPVHMMDIHLEKGMHCVDCHFNQDVHGDTKLYGEVRAAIEIACVDCHGSASKSVTETLLAAMRDRQTPVGNRQRVTMKTSGPAAKEVNGTDLLSLTTPFGKPRFEVVETRGEPAKLIQNSMVEPNKSWDVVQTKSTIDPAHPKYNVKSHMAKTVRFAANGRMKWGGQVGDVDCQEQQCAHQDSRMSCISCHSSWNPSCFGCHLPQRANKKAANLHNLGETSRNLVSYNFQTLRDDVYMLAHDGQVTGQKIGPARSSCAIHVTSYNANREGIYTQQQTISAEGMSGIAFSSNVPHTVRGGSGLSYENGSFRGGVYETKGCADCHVSEKNDNNALMSQLLMQGTGYTNFIGRYVWVAAGHHGLESVVVTEQPEPQAVIGSTLHKLAYPENYRKHHERNGFLEHSHEHPGSDILEQLTRKFKKLEILDVQARGEYLYAACGDGGLRVFDIAFIDHKGFSERITTAPVSPLGQKFYVRTKHATSVAAPTTIAPDPTRTHDPLNAERPVHPLYGHIFVTDKYEGLILVGAGTLLDGNPLNNFLERSVTFNPDGILCGAESVTIAGTFAYVCCDAGLVVVSLEDPTHPRVTSVLGYEVLEHPKSIQVQFRYGFVCDEHGVQVLDVTDLSQPRHVATLELQDAHSVYLARQYAYVAAGHTGLVIVDIRNPEHPVIDQIYDAGGKINDAHDVQLGITNVSQFAYVADGHNGVRVIQLTSPDTPGNDGFSPRPTPCLIATYKLPKGGEALALSRGIDRDRAVDESGNQIAVFGRVGAGPLTLAEQRRMYLHKGRLYRVSENPFDKRIYDVAPGTETKVLRNHPSYQRFIVPPHNGSSPRKPREAGIGGLRFDPIRRR